jgi:hypothetical protein
MSKGIAVVSGSSDLKHKLMDNGVAELGVTNAVSTLSGTVVLLGETSSDLATRINTTKGNVTQRITTSTTAADQTTGEKTAEVNTTSEEMVGNTSRTHGAGGGTYAVGGNLFLCDQQLDNQLSASRDSITTVNGGTGVDGSLAKAIDQYLKGPGLTGNLATISALSASILDTDLTGTVAIAISQMKNSVYHGTASVTATSDNLSASLANIAAQTVTAVAKEGVLDGKINLAVTSIGLDASDRSLSYSGTDYLDGNDVNGANINSIKLAQDELVYQHGLNVTRLAAMTGAVGAAKTETAQMTVIANKVAKFKGDVTIGSSFTAPYCSTVNGAGDELQSPAAPENGEFMYVSIDAATWSARPVTGMKFKGSTETLPENNKFYFFENGHWFASPFHSE